MPGAFTKTIRERNPVLQFDHGTHPVIGSVPLGVITSLTEDSHGLRVRARLADNWLVEPVREAIAAGAIDGMSFKFRVIQQDWERGNDRTMERSITEIALYEVGPVVWSAYEDTSVGVRSAEVAQLLGDETVRQEVARDLLAPGTPVGAATPDTEPEPHSARAKNQRLRVVAGLTVH